MPVETGGRDDHVRRTRSLSRRALGGDRDPGRLYRFCLAARIRSTPGVSRRVLLAGAAAFLAVGIWTMHFVGMLAAPIPSDTVYLVLPTIVSFLICALVVGVSLFFLSIGEPSQRRVISSAVLLGAGIVSMHYVGIHGLAGNFGIEHDTPMILLSILIAIGAAYGGLRAFLARQDGIRLIASSIAFGIAVSGMHYTAMYGMHFVPLAAGGHHHAEGLAASQQILSVVVAVLCFVIAAGFLLSLVPDPRRQTAALAVDPAAERRVSRRRSREPARRPRAFPAADVGAARRPRSAAASGTGTAASDRGRRRHPFHRYLADAGASAPTRIIPGCMTAPASGCARGRSRRPRPSSIPACSSASTAATSWRSRMSASCARRVTAR